MNKRLHPQQFKISAGLFGLLAQLSFADPIATLESNVVYQVAPIAALAKGLYADKSYSYAELKKHGDFGLGTFLNLDGEMIALDGNFYQMMADGRVRLVDDKQTLPFAEVNYFHPTLKPIGLPAAKSFTLLTNQLFAFFKNKNVPYAIRIDGTFSSLKLRAVRKQKVPFTPLSEVAKNQAVFNFSNVKGTLIGYWFPEYLSGVAVTGFHLHFIDSSRSIGGHVLDLNMLSGTLNLEQLSNLQLYFPNSSDFANVDLADKTIANTINQAEKDH